MIFLTQQLALQLKEKLEGTRAQVLTYESEEYAKSIQRWSDTCEKEAVRAGLQKDGVEDCINQVCRAPSSE
jgi:hypothetical protein